MKIVPYAFRNVWRSRHHTFVTILAMAFTGFIMIFYASLMEGFVRNMERNAVGMDLGDIQIHAPGYREDPDLYKRIKNPDEIIKKLKSAGFTATQRLYGFGLGSSGSSSAGVTMRGIDMQNEMKVTQMYRHILEGSWLSETDPKGVVIGRKLARTLGVKPGDEIVILSQAADGSMANDLYTLKGILKSVGAGVDRTALLMTEKSFRELMALPEGAHEIAAMRTDRTTDLQTATEKARKIAPGLEVKNWRELQPLLARMNDLIDNSLIFMLLIAYVAIGMVVLNATLMSVFERIRELGVMKALGLSPLGTATLIFTEAMIKTTAAALFAVATGVPLSLYYQTHGIDLSAVTGGSTITGIAFDPVWHSRLTYESVIMPVVLLFAVVGLSALYPAVKAALIVPVKAIYYR
ncbi:MAG: ABC transporter permease [Nitrospinota bacterium]